MPPTDTEVDRLYQLSLQEFTAERNALAKARGAAGAPIRKLQKPSVPAWAVNQLYWHRRRVYDALIQAATRRREAHGARLAGRDVDLDALEQAHQAALRDAVASVRALLRDAGEAETSATINQVTDTLQALPGDDPPGRLVRPLKPQGFEALAGLVSGGAWTAAARVAGPATAARGGAGRTTSPPAASAATKAEKRAAVVAARRAAEHARRQAQARAREAAKVEKQVRAARAGERLAEAAFTRARTALARAERDRDRLEDQIKFLGKQIQDLVEEIRRRERELAQAAADRTQLERRLASLRDQTGRR
ncbi:MAG: hypothetical protein R2752_01475 [Vicinamibacterales bacterium]